MASPVDIVRRFYAALGGGDVPTAVSLLDPQVEWTEAERFPYYSGTWHGPQAVVDNLLVPIAGDWDGFSVEPHEFIAQGDRVVSLGTYSGRSKKTGQPFSAAFAHVWTVRGDKLARFNMHTDTAKVLEAFGIETARPALNRMAVALGQTSGIAAKCHVWTAPAVQGKRI